VTIVRAIRSEFGKLLTVRLWWVLLLILVVYVAFTAGLLALLFGALGEQVSATPGGASLPVDQLPPIVYSSATTVGYVFPLILGALTATSEFRYQTLTPTFLAVPRRSTVLLAKLVVLLVTGALFGVAALVAAMGAGAALLELGGNPSALDDPDTWALAGRVVIAMAIWTVIGLGLGTLIPNQVASIVIVLALTQFVEPILRFGSTAVEWTAEIGKFLPGAASDALVGASIYTTFAFGSSEAKVLEWWQGGLVLLTLGVVLVAVGGVTTWRRDVT
jgi:ABC-2 type transport system permease protein